MAHGERASWNERKHMDYDSGRYHRYDARGKTTKVFTHRYERRQSDRITYKVVHAVVETTYEDDDD